MTSVTFPPSLGGDGSTVSDDSNPVTGLGNGGHRTRFVPAMSQVLACMNGAIDQAETQVALAADQVDLAADQVALAAAQVSLAAGQAANAAASAAAAAANDAAPMWVSGTNYQAGDVVWSPADPNRYNYRAKVAITPSTIDPYNNSANWTVQVSKIFSEIEVLNISADTSLTALSKNVVRVASTVRGVPLRLPAGTAIANAPGMYVVKNVGDFTLPLQDQDGTPLSFLPKAATGIYTLEDASTSAGVWGVIAPESRPAMAFPAATVEAVSTAWVGVSEIPGVANKALIAWVTGTSLKVAIATRNPTTRAVTVGAVLTLTTGLANAQSAMVKALSSTTAIAAGYINNTTAYSLTLNTSTDTVTTTGNVGFGVAVNGGTQGEPQQLDATRVAWMVSTNVPNRYINIVTHAATPTGAQTGTLASANLDVASAAIVGVGGGNILGTSNSGGTLFTTSGNVATAASTVATYSNAVNTNSRQVGFSAGAANRATFVACMGTINNFEGEVSYTITPTGTTLPASPNAVSRFSSIALAQNSLSNFIAGASYCVMGGTSAAAFGVNLRVMRYTDAQLSEVAYGGIEGLPAGVTSSQTRAAAVSGQACIAFASGTLIFSMEVIKA